MIQPPAVSRNIAHAAAADDDDVGDDEEDDDDSEEIDDVRCSIDRHLHEILIVVLSSSLSWLLNDTAVLELIIQSSFTSLTTAAPNDDDDDDDDITPVDDDDITPDDDDVVSVTPPPLLLLLRSTVQSFFNNLYFLTRCAVKNLFFKIFSSAVNSLSFVDIWPWCFLKAWLYTFLRSNLDTTKPQIGHFNKSFDKCSNLNFDSILYFIILSYPILWVS